MNCLRITTLFFLLNALAIPLVHARGIWKKDIPFVIKHPGTYYLEEDIEYKEGDAAAITIASDSVTLSLNSFTIDLSDRKATGILAEGVSDFVIRNGFIKNGSSKKQKGIGIAVVNCNKGFIGNIFTRNHHNGLLVRYCKDVVIQDSQFYHAKEAAYVRNARNVVFDNCVFAHSTNGIRFGGRGNQDCSIANSQFPSSKLSNLYVEQVNGMMVDNCSFTNLHGSSDKLNLVQFGGRKRHQVCYDVTFKNSTIVNRPKKNGNTAPEGLGIYQGSGFLVDSIVIDINNECQDPAADLSGIHISNPCLGKNGVVASNVTVRNSIIQGPATDGIYPDAGSYGIVIENNFVSGAQKNGIFLAGTTASTVMGNTVVNNGTNGIFLGQESTLNAVSNNTVDSNGYCPIETCIPPFGNGIGVSSDSSGNILQGNTVFNNAVNGINDQGTNEQIFSNVAYANTDNADNNYVSVSSIIVNTPGQATQVGGNTSA